MAYARSKSFEQDQQKFQDFYAWKHLDSIGFLKSVHNSVGKQELYKTRPKQLQKDLAGRVVGRVAASIETRRCAARAEANRALLHCDEVLRVGDLNLSWDDQSLSDWAMARAEKCARIISNDDYALHVLRWIVHGYGFEWPAYDLFGDAAAVARICDVKWWRRRARVAKARAIDQLARSFRMVHAKAQPYASNELVQLRRLQARRNRSVLEGWEAVNQEGQTYTLAELSDLSVSNPTNRRHELMIRIKGFEQIADSFGHEGLFVTMAAPSMYHPMRQIKNAKGKLVRVTENRNYGTYGNKKFTPRDAQDWLCKTWALIRAEFARQGIRCYGFRVVEPHHDGCPHWHQLLFFKKYDLTAAERIYKRYMLRTNGFEKGAGNRLKIVTIDKAKGSAAGYIAKYIAKSIDGSHIDKDLLGNDSVHAAERICAWASGWGIRQFQQIGGASVTVWRELRRMDISEGVVEQARAAVDASDWAAYCLVQGDDLPFFGRDDQQIRPAYWLEHDELTGQVVDEPFNKYGEASVGKLFGVVLVKTCEYFLSRFYRWTVQRVGTAAAVLKKALPTLSDDDLLDLLRGDGSGSINREAIALDLCQ